MMTKKGGSFRSFREWGGRLFLMLLRLLLIGSPAPDLH